MDLYLDKIEDEKAAEVFRDLQQALTKKPFVDGSFSLLEVNALHVKPSSSLSGGVTPPVEEVSLTDDVGSIVASVREFNDPPTDCLPCNGSSYSALTYPILAQKLWDQTNNKWKYGGTGSYPDGNFFTPNLQGIAMRGAGTQTYGGVTYTATLGEKRNDAIQNITGSIAATTYQRLSGAKSGAFGNISGATAQDESGTYHGAVQSGINFDASRVARTDTQTHGADLAVNFFIRTKHLLRGERGERGQNGNVIHKVDNIAALEALIIGDRYEGMLVYVVDQKLTYQLVGGLTNSHWTNVYRNLPAEYSDDVGAIVSSARDSTNPPEYHLYCGGALVSALDYPLLADHMWDNSTSKWKFGGTGNKLTGSFNLPDLRGRFLRGLDTTLTRDADGASRTASAAGGNTGATVGSSQNSAVQRMTGSFRTADNDTNTYFVKFLDITGVFYGSNAPAGSVQFNSGTSTTNATFSGYINFDSYNALPNNTSSHETRPQNTSVNYFIRYIPTGKGEKGDMGPAGPAGADGTLENEPIGVIKEYAGLVIPEKYVRIDDGKKFYNHALYPNLFSLIGSSFGKGIPRFNNNSLEWSLSYIGATNKVVSLAHGPITSSYVYIIVTTDKVFISTDYGDTWTNTGLTTTGQFTSIGYAPNSPYFIVTTDAGIIHKYNGSTWTAQTVRAGATFFDIKWCGGAINLWTLVANNGTTAQQIYSSPAAATTWTARTVPTAVGNWVKISIKDNSIIVISGETGRLIYSTNGTAYTNLALPNLYNISIMSKHTLIEGLAPDEIPEQTGFVLIASNSLTGFTDILFSVDGINWDTKLEIDKDVIGSYSNIPKYAAIIDGFIFIGFSSAVSGDVFVFVRLGDGAYVFENKASPFLISTPFYSHQFSEVHFSGSDPSVWFFANDGLRLFSTKQIESRLPRQQGSPIVSELLNADSGHIIRANGLIEQWGKTTVSSAAEVITFPIEMNGNYWASATIDLGSSTSAGNGGSCEISTKKSNSMVIHHSEYGAASADVRFNRSATSSWMVRGWVANIGTSASLPYIKIMKVL